jgi:hypothetical protein
MLSLAVTILRIGSQECLDKATANLFYDSRRGVSVTHPASQVKKLPEHSRL